MATLRAEQYDAQWLLEHEGRRFDAFGHRETINSLICWRNPDNPNYRDANHVAIPVGTTVSESELATVLDRQVDEYATRCVDVYGPPSTNDQLCTDLGMQPEEPNAVIVMVWRARSWTGRLRKKRHPVETVSPDEWVAVQTGLHVDGLEPWGRKAARLESQIPNTSYYATRFRERRLSALLRHDWVDISQIESVFTHFVYRDRGLAASCLARALEESPHDDVFLTVWEHNADAVRLYSKAGAEIVARDIIRRYIG